MVEEEYLTNQFARYEENAKPTNARVQLEFKLGGSQDFRTN